MDKTPGTGNEPVFVYPCECTYTTWPFVILFALYSVNSITQSMVLIPRSRCLHWMLNLCHCCHNILLSTVRCEKVYERRMLCLFKLVDSVHQIYRYNTSSASTAQTRYDTIVFILRLNLKSNCRYLVMFAALTRHWLLGSKQLMDYVITGHLNEKVH